MWQVVVGTAASGIGSVLLAAWFTRALLGRWSWALLSLAAGALLATALLHLLPEAFESDISPQILFVTLLAGLVFFFFLDKAELWHHGHEHHQAPMPLPAELATEHGHPGHEASQSPARLHGHTHAHGPRVGTWTILLGDSIHCLGDGIMVAAAFLSDPALGWAASVAVMSHETPHHIGDLVVLRQNGQLMKSAVLRLCAAGAVTVVGGVMGFQFLSGHEAWLPYLLVLASSSYVYVALADLIPQLQQRQTTQESVTQIGFLSLGIALVMFAVQLTHVGH